jgi:hypothetical protein
MSNEQDKLRRNKEYNRQYHKQHYHKYRARLIANVTIHRHMTKRIFYEIIGGPEPKCMICGLSDIRYFNADHINGDGKTDRNRFRDTYTMYRYYIKHPEEAKLRLQVLCFACNLGKKRT